MPDRDEEAWGGVERPNTHGRKGLIASAAAVVARALEAEADRWFLWLPVLFAGDIVAYFALHHEPGLRIVATLVAGAFGLWLTLRHIPLGLALSSAALAFSLGFATAKLRTEMVPRRCLSRNSATSPSQDSSKRSSRAPRRGRA